MKEGGGRGGRSELSLKQPDQVAPQEKIDLRGTGVRKKKTGALRDILELLVGLDGRSDSDECATYGSLDTVIQNDGGAHGDNKSLSFQRPNNQ